MEKNLKVYWLIIIVITLISTFIFIETCNSHKDLVQYFGFAGSVTSLVLAIIAIFYSIVSNQQSTENFGKLKEAVLKIEEGAKSLNELSNGINSRLDNISHDIIRFATKDKNEQSASNNSLNADKIINENINDANQPDEAI